MIHPDDVALVEQYVVAMTRRNFAWGTIDKRRRTVELMACVGRLADLTVEQIESAIDARDLTARSRYCWISHLSCFYDWAVALEHFERNPLRKLQRPKMRRLTPRPARESEVELAIAQAPSPTVRAWVVLGAFAGLRCAEIAGLRGEDIDRDAREMRVVGKGNKERVVPMHARVLEVLASAPRSGVVFRDPLLGQPFEPMQVSRIGGKFLSTIGISNRKMHQLRHRFATALLDEGADIATVADLMGHENLNTTRGYAASSTGRMRRAVDLLA